MKLNEMAFAKAHAMVGGVFFVICRAWAMFDRSSLSMIGSSWFHTVDLNQLPMKSLDFGSAVFGFVTFTAFAAAWGYFIAWAYNWAMKK